MDQISSCQLRKGLALALPISVLIACLWLLWRVWYYDVSYMPQLGTGMTIAGLLLAYLINRAIGIYSEKQ